MKSHGTPADPNLRDSQPKSDWIESGRAEPGGVGSGRPASLHPVLASSHATRQDGRPPTTTTTTSSQPQGTAPDGLGNMGALTTVR
jgi:hypothetical protein